MIINSITNLVTKQKAMIELQQLTFLDWKIMDAQHLRNHAKIALIGPTKCTAGLFLLDDMQLPKAKTKEISIVSSLSRILHQDVFSESFRLRRHAKPLCRHCNEYLSRAAVWKHVRFYYDLHRECWKVKEKVEHLELKTECQQESNEIGKKRQKCENRNLVKLRPLVLRIDRCVVQLSNGFLFNLAGVTILDFRARCDTIGPENKPF